jgi:hypothetical protein
MALLYCMSIKQGTWLEIQVMIRQREDGESGKKTRITGLLTFSSAMSMGRELSLKNKH